jgi:hypothetical protein
MLLPAFFVSPANANPDLGLASQQCASLRAIVLHHVGDRAKEMLFASSDMNRNGLLNPGVANEGFKAIQLAVMHFDFAYEEVAMGGKANAEAFYRLALQFGQSVDGYIDDVLVSGELPR